VQAIHLIAWVKILPRPSALGGITRLQRHGDGYVITTEGPAKSQEAGDGSSTGLEAAFRNVEQLEKSLHK
jgi:hypothetical protein